MSDERLDPRTAHRLARAAQAAQQLSDLLWEALREELADPRSEQVADLSQRLVSLAGVVGSLARSDEGLSAGAPAEAPDESTAARVDPPQGRPAPPASAERAAPVLVDELIAQAPGEDYAARARRRPSPARENQP